MGVFLLMAAGQAGLAQDQKVVRDSGCQDENLEDGYIVRSSRLDDPFRFLPWVATRERQVAAEIGALVNGRPFRYDTAVNRALDIINSGEFLPATDAPRVRVSVEVVTVENCSKPDLDLVYRVYSMQVKPVLSGTPEAREIEKRSPQSTAGLADTDVATRPVHLTPLAGYDAADKLFGGARLTTGIGKIGRSPFSSIVLEGTGSAKTRFFSGGLAGFADSSGWLAHSEWLVNYTNSLIPAGAGELRQAHLSGQFSGATRVFANGNLTSRFGLSLEGGNQHGAIPDAGPGSATAASAGFGAIKFYGGLDSRLPHQIYSVSYGLALGSIGPGLRIDWRKHIGDIRHEFWYPVGDHHTLDLESRFTAGGIQVPGKIPLPERFFGGNREELFMPGDSWQIRANPVIRAIPASRLYQTGDGAGGNRFFSYNLTAAYAVWRRPLVPRELNNDPQFRSLLEGQIATATSVEEIRYATNDPHFRTIMEELPALQDDLAKLKSEVTSAQSARPGQLVEQFRACTSAANMAASRARSAAGATGSQKYGLVSSLLPVDRHEDRLAKVTQACQKDLEASPAVQTAAAKVEEHRRKIELEFGRIDKSAAAGKARAEMSFVRRTLNTLFTEANLYSISLVSVFDVAKIGPEANGLGGLRYGPGAGIRLGLASMVNLTAGYAWNIRRGPGEGPGAVFFSLSVRDLFH